MPPGKLARKLRLISEGQSLALHSLGWVVVNDESRGWVKVHRRDRIPGVQEVFATPTAPFCIKEGMRLGQSDVQEVCGKFG